MAPTLHLYGVTGSCSLAPHILLRESGLPFTSTLYTRAEIIAAGGYPASLLALNPKAKVPVVKFNDEVITENPAIFTLIAQLAPSSNLLGKGGVETVRVYEWLNYLSGTVHGQAYGMFFRPWRFTDAEDGSLNARVQARAKVMLQECYKYIDEKLEGRTWAVGDAFTAVDVYLFVFYRWGTVDMGFDMKGEYPNYAKVMGEVVKRETVKEALRVEGLEEYA